MYILLTGILQISGRPEAESHLVWFDLVSSARRSFESPRTSIDTSTRNDACVTHFTYNMQERVHQIGGSRHRSAKESAKGLYEYRISPSSPSLQERSGYATFLLSPLCISSDTGNTFSTKPALNHCVVMLLLIIGTSLALSRDRDLPADSVVVQSNDCYCLFVWGHCES
ncbi:hypothetical protein J3458_020801 [Metarhizium acridum]|uniref:uncharacterized protein n=1 Tax=Metarhizium acridum TaxID=92637 RepID=UPI001C6BE473|nr:hypothetical protein J3458_020801 [Metarhizium acridum]